MWMCKRGDVTTTDEPKESNMADTPHHAGLLSGCRVLDFTQYLEVTHRSHHFQDV